MKNSKEYTITRFGYRFKIIVNNNNTTAILIPYKPTSQYGPYIGTAMLNAPDVYDSKLGELIAVKSALTKCHSDIMGKSIRKAHGFRNRMRAHNKRLNEAIEEIRNQQEDIP